MSTTNSESSLSASAGVNGSANGSVSASAPTAAATTATSFVGRAAKIVEDAADRVAKAAVPYAEGEKSEIIGQKVGGAVDAVATRIGLATDGSSSSSTPTVSTIDAGNTTASSQLGGYIDAAKEKIRSTVEGISETAANLKDAAAERLDAAVVQGKRTLDDAGITKNQPDAKIPRGDEAQEPSATTATTFKETLQDAVQNVQENVPSASEVIGNAKEVAKDAIQETRKTLSSVNRDTSRRSNMPAPSQRSI
eukprot:ANDGO_05297.mRNA.1 hypothetical protein